MNPKVILIILNWNGKEDTIECLDSLKNITYTNYKVLLIDNGSSDDSVKYFSKEYPGMEIIDNEKNLGFAEGNNVGIRKAMEMGANYTLLLNNDTIVEKNFLDELVKVAESDNQIGIVGPKIYYYDYNGRKDVIWFAGGRVIRRIGQPFHYGLNKIDNGKYEEEKIVDYITGCALLIKMDVIKKVGLLNSDYFAYFEDLEYNIKVSAIGYKIIYTPKAKIWHKGSSTSGYMSPNYIYFHTRNRIFFVKKNTNLLDFLFLFLPYFIIFRIIRVLLILAVKKNWDGIKALSKGIKEGMTSTVK